MSGSAQLGDRCVIDPDRVICATGFHLFDQMKALENAAGGAENRTIDGSAFCSLAV